jgi:Ion channel
LTIGYGRIVPASNLGKLLTILYSAIGITVVAFLLVSFEDHLEVGKEKEDDSPTRVVTEDGTGGIPMQQFSTINSVMSTATQMSISPKKAFMRKYRVYMVVLVWYFVSSAIFSWLEGWSYVDGLYFCFTTMTVAVNLL